MARDSAEEVSMTIYAELAAMKPGARKKLVNSLVATLHESYCEGCGGDLNTGHCQCGKVTRVTFHPDGSVTAKTPKRAK